MLVSKIGFSSKDDTVMKLNFIFAPALYKQGKLCEHRLNYGRVRSMDVAWTLGARNS